MLQHQPSRTAEYMAMFRASEHAKGAGRRVFTDPLAVALLPGSLRLPAKLLAVRPVGDMLTRFIDRQWPGARLFHKKKSSPRPPMWLVSCQIGVPPILTSVAIGLGKIAGRAPILSQPFAPGMAGMPKVSSCRL